MSRRAMEPMSPSLEAPSRRERTFHKLSVYGRAGLLLSALAGGLGLAACSRGGSEAESAAPPATSVAALTHEAQDSLIGDYCVTCHNFEDSAGGLELTVFQSADAALDPELAEKMIRKLRAGMMPPAGEDRPDFETEQALAAALESTVDAHSHYAPAWPGLHRLNRTEYQNVVHDLLALDVDATTLLPGDDSSNGFDNQAGALGLSPVLLEAYVAAAGKIAQLAVGDVTTPSQTVYRVAEDTTQNYQVDGLPLGTRGGLVVEHTFPTDGEYTIKIFPVNVGNMGNFRAFGGVKGEQLEVLVDGEQVAHFDWDKALGGGGFASDDEDTDSFRGQLRTIDATIHVTAGPHKVGVTFIATNFAPGLDLNNAFDRSTIETGGIPGFTFYPHIGRIRIDGPQKPEGVSDTPSQRKLFVCRPASADEEAACGQQIARAFARRAYRGAATDEDVATLVSFYESARAQGGFAAGVEALVERALSDPKFIYRIETPPASAAPGETYPVSDLELASRLSFFLWSSMPDDELLTLAEQGKLRSEGVLEAQIARMLEDPRSEAFTINFAGQWLALRSLEGHAPVTSEFPDFDDNLRKSLRRETELFFDSLVRENRSALELLTADYTFLDERLARHYGIPGIWGPRFRKVELGDEHPERRGLLGKGALMTVTSQPGRTSPVVRGNWIMTHLIGVPAPPPPPDVPIIEVKTADAAGNVKPKTVREQYEEHRANPACAGCHNMMDPIGFALEPYDAVGKFRHEDAGNPINASGTLYDGSPIDGPDGLRSFLIQYKEQVIRNLTEKMVTYALGRGLEPEDMPVVRAIDREAAKSDYRFHALIQAIVESPAFDLNTAPPLAQASTDSGRPTAG